MPWRMHMYINSVNRAGANTSKQQRQIKYVNKLLLLQKGTLDVYYIHHTEEFSGYSLHRLFNNTICLEVSTEKTRSTCTPSPHHTALPFSTHTWANLSINICASAISPVACDTEVCGEGENVERGKVVLLLLVYCFGLYHIILVWFGSVCTRFHPSGSWKFCARAR